MRGLIPLSREHVRLLDRESLGVDHLKLQIRILELDERLAGFDELALLDVDRRDLAAFDRVEVHRGARHDVAGDRDVLVERAVGDLRDREPLRADRERAAHAEAHVRVGA